MSLWCHRPRNRPHSLVNIDIQRFAFKIDKRRYAKPPHLGRLFYCAIFRTRPLRRDISGTPAHLALCEAERTDLLGLGLDGDQPRDGNSGGGNDDFFPGGDLLQKTRQMGLGLMDIDYHQVMLDSSPWAKSKAVPSSRLLVFVAS